MVAIAPPSGRAPAVRPARPPPSLPLLLPQPPLTVTQREPPSHLTPAPPPAPAVPAATYPSPAPSGGLQSRGVRMRQGKEEGTRTRLLAHLGRGASGKGGATFAHALFCSAVPQRSGALCGGAAFARGRHGPGEEQGRGLGATSCGREDLPPPARSTRGRGFARESAERFPNRVFCQWVRCA